MNRFNIPPLFCQVLRNQATMTVVRFLFAAQETPTVQQFRGNRRLDSSLPHQFNKSGRVVIPATLLLLKTIEELLSGRELFEVYVVDSRNLFQEISEIVLLSKSRKLRNIIQANINDATNSGFTEATEKRLRSLLGEPNRE